MSQNVSRPGQGHSGTMKHLGMFSRAKLSDLQLYLSNIRQ